MSETAGVPYGEPMAPCCMWVCDDTRFAVRICGGEPAYLGCSWCEAHRRRVFAQVSKRPRRRVHAMEAVAA